MDLVLPYREKQIAIENIPYGIPLHNPNSTDNVAPPEPTHFLGEPTYSPSSRHRILLQQDDQILATLLLLASGGATGIHEHSAFIHENTCYIAVGPYICALTLPTLQLTWHTLADRATCFGLHHAPAHASIISHGELQIARLDYTGKIIWSQGGKDIFTGNLRLYPDHIEVPDFEDAFYKFDLQTGAPR